MATTLKLITKMPSGFGKVAVKPILVVVTHGNNSHTTTKGTMLTWRFVVTPVADPGVLEARLGGHSPPPVNRQYRIIAYKCINIYIMESNQCQKYTASIPSLEH